MVSEEPVKHRIDYQRGYNDGLKVGLDALRKFKESQEKVEPYHGIVTESSYAAARVD